MGTGNLTGIHRGIQLNCGRQGVAGAEYIGPQQGIVHTPGTGGKVDSTIARIS